MLKLRYAALIGLLAVLQICEAGLYVRDRWCHANVFATKFHADWEVAFIGDSTTQLWTYPATNWGFVGATTSDLLGILKNTVRCRCYKSIVILAGVNDALKSKMTSETVANLDAMVVEAQSKGLSVYLATIPPVYGRYVDKNTLIDRTNVGIRAIAQQRRVHLLEYNHAMVGHPEYVWDGIHITNLGYGAMTRVLHQEGVL